jgi:hypothetical protein
VVKESLEKSSFQICRKPEFGRPMTLMTLLFEFQLCHATGQGRGD